MKSKVSKLHVAYKKPEQNRIDVLEELFVKNSIRRALKKKQKQDESRQG